MKTQPNNKRRFVILFSWLAILLVGASICYFSAYRITDYFLCRTFIGLRLGIGISPFAVDNYLEDNLIPGMSRDDVRSVLENIGSVEIIPSQGGFQNEEADQAIIKVCSHRFNHIVLFLVYSTDNKLISVKTVGD
jgi:hypothetical protein